MLVTAAIESQEKALTVIIDEQDMFTRDCRHCSTNSPDPVTVSTKVSTMTMGNEILTMALLPRTHPLCQHTTKQETRRRTSTMRTQIKESKDQKPADNHKRRPTPSSFFFRQPSKNTHIHCHISRRRIWEPNRLSSQAF